MRDLALTVSSFTLGRPGTGLPARVRPAADTHGHLSAQRLGGLLPGGQAVNHPSRVMIYGAQPPTLTTMSAPKPVTVGPPNDEGGRLVHIDGVPVGRAYGLWDMIVFLRQADLHRGLADEEQIAASPLINWLGGDADQWDP